MPAVLLKIISVNGKNFNLFACAVITLTALAAYSNNYDCTFHFDDFVCIHDDEKIKDINNFSEAEAWLPGEDNRTFKRHYRPVSTFTLALNYHLHALEPAGYLLFNNMVHAANGILVYWLVLLIFSLGPSGTPDRNRIPYAALFTALIFTAHPLQTQSVTYIVQRMSSIGAFFFFLSLIYYIRAGKALAGAGGNFRVILNYTACLLFANLALFSKESMATIFPVLAITEIFFFTGDRKRSLVIRSLPFLLCALYLLLFMIYSGFSIPAAQQSQGLGRADYLMTQFIAITKYIFLLFAPAGQTIDHHVEIAREFFSARVLAPFIFLCVTGTAGLALFKKNRILSYSVLWFFITLSVESSIFPTALDDVMFEHRLYLPLFAFALSVPAVFSRLTAKMKSRAFIAPLAALCAVYASLTFARNFSWKTELSLWEEAAQRSPAKIRALYNYADALAREGRVDEAREISDRIDDRHSKKTELMNSLGVQFAKKENYSMAFACFERSVELDPRNYIAAFNLASLYAFRGHPQKALEYFRAALSIDEDNPDLLVKAGTAALNLGDRDGAERFFIKALEIQADNAAALENLKALRAGAKGQKILY